MIYGTVPGATVITASVSATSQYEQILNRFANILEDTNSYTRKVENVSDKLVPIPQTDTKSPVGDPSSPIGLLSRFDQLVDRLYSYNIRLENATDQLYSYL